MKQTLPPETEAAFQKRVTDLATLCGWEWYHTRLSLRSKKGFPDLILWNNRPRIWEKFGYVELKRDDRDPTVPQCSMLLRLLDASLFARHTFVDVWKPKDWPDIEEILRGEEKSRLRPLCNLQKYLKECLEKGNRKRR